MESLSAEQERALVLLIDSAAMSLWDQWPGQPPDSDPFEQFRKLVVAHFSEHWEDYKEAIESIAGGDRTPRDAADELAREILREYVYDADRDGANDDL